MDQEKLLLRITLVSSFISGLINHKGINDISDSDIQSAIELSDKVINTLIH